METKSDNICRGCMISSSKPLQPIFVNNIADLFYSITCLKISHDDGLPNSLCVTCLNRLEDCNRFRNQCTQSDHLFRKNIENADSNNSQIVEVDGKDSIRKSSRIKESKAIIETPETPLQIIQEEIIDETPSDDDYYSEEEEEDENIVQIPEVTDEKRNKKSRPYIPKNLAKNYDPRKNYKFPFRCHICNRGFRYKERFDGHLREHEGKRAAVCEFCDREYTKWSGLQHHMEQCHKTDMKYVCFCGKAFMYESALITHKVSHGGPKTFKICETCGKSFPDQYQLNKHFLAHQTETPFACSECPKKFKSDFHLRAHQFRHKGIRNFQCQICGKSVATRPELRSHMLVHSADKNYKCTICDKVFRHKSQVASHTRTHTGQKPYKCDICLKCFTCLNSLKIHKRIHSGEKPYVCTICNRAFAQGSVLKTHMKVHAKKEPPAVK